VAENYREFERMSHALTTLVLFFSLMLRSLKAMRKTKNIFRYLELIEAIE